MISPTLRQAFRAGKRALDVYTNHIDNDILYFVAHALDPRFKLTSIQKHYTPGKAEDIKQHVVEWCKVLGTGA